MRVCTQCDRKRADKFFVSERGRVCSSCRKKNQSDANHRSRINRMYGLSFEDYERLMEHQEGVCAICKGERKYRLNVDHDHKTGLTRGLLCRRCNKVLRDLRDSTEIARGVIAYLDEPPASKIGVIAVAVDELRDN